MISVRIQGKSFGGAAVLGPISFEIAKGETLAITGPSGVGKSTLLRIVAGIDETFEGEVRRPAAIGLVFQEPTLLPWRDARANLTIMHPDLGPEGAETMLAKVGLTGKGDFFPGQLSLGQQRRLALARAFAGTPDLLILDEPFVSLDPETHEAMLALTETLIADTGPATLFVTHARDEAVRLAGRILTLSGAPAGLAEFEDTAGVAGS